MHCIKTTSLGRGRTITGTRWIILVQDTKIQIVHTPERKGTDKDAKAHAHEVENGGTVGTTRGSRKVAGAERGVDKGDHEDRAKDGER